MIDPYWFQKKWGTMKQDVPTDVLFKRIKELEERVVKLEEENIENTNLIYELMNSLEAIDNRIDIIMCEPYKLPTNAEKLR